MFGPKMWNFSDALAEIEKVVDAAKRGEVKAVLAIEEMHFRNNAAKVARDAAKMLEPLTGIRAADDVRARISQACGYIQRSENNLMETSRWHVRKAAKALTEVDVMPDSVSALAYALWDAESTTRLPPEHYDEYATRARSLLYVMRLRPDDERDAIAEAIRQAGG